MNTLSIAHCIELIAAGAIVLSGFIQSDRIGRIPYAIYFIFYIITSLIGGLIIFFSQNNMAFWNAIFFNADSLALPSPLPERYFQLLVAPLLVVPTVVIALRWLFPIPRYDDTITVTFEKDEVTSISIISIMGSLYCIVDMLRGGVPLTGYVLSAGEFTDYAAKMLARHGAFTKITNVSLAVIYTLLPMTAAIFILLRKFFVKGSVGRRVTTVAFFVIVLFDFYLCTVVYVKGQIVITIIYAAIAISMVGRIRLIHMGAFGILGVLLLGLLYYLLSYSGGSLQGGVAARLAILTAFYQVFFRMAIGLPFYASLFPDVLPHPGVALGPTTLGMAPAFAANSAVFNYVAPFTDTALQGHQPAPAHFSAYAGGGMVPALVCLVLVGIVIYLTGRVGRNVRTALGAGMTVVWCIYIYYATQTDLLAGFWATYGPLWAIFFYIACLVLKALIGAMRRTP
jgi:hypothetical protein